MSRFDCAMLDIETMDNVPTAKVVQIALVPFDTDISGEFVYSTEPFVEKIEWKDQFYATESEETMTWWERQNPEIFDDVFNKGFRDHMSVALESLKAYCAETLMRGYKVYCHSSFDQPIMNFHSRNVGVDLPWNPFSQVVDLRTLERTARKMEVGYSRPPRDESKSHDALYDCIYQIQYLAEIRKTLGVIV